MTCQSCLGSWLAAPCGYLALPGVRLVFSASLPSYPRPSLSKTPLGDVLSPSTFDYFAIRGKSLARTCSGPALVKAHGRNLTHWDFSVTILAIKSGSYAGLGIDVSSGSSWSRGSSRPDISDGQLHLFPNSREEIKPKLRELVSAAA